MARGLLLALAFAAIQASPADLRLVEAAQAGRSKQALRLVREKVDVNVRDDRGYSALIWAASWGDLELANALLDRGAHVNTPAASGATAFSVAVENGHDAVLKALIKAGSNCRNLDPGWDPVKASRQPVVAGIVKRAVRLGEELLQAVEANDLHRVKVALADGAPVGYTRAPDGNTPLMQALSANIEIIRALLAAGAPVSDDHVTGRSPLDNLRPPTHPEAVQLLLNARPPATVISRARMPRANDADLRRVLTRIENAAANLPDTNDRARILQAVRWMLPRAAGSVAEVSDVYRRELEISAQKLESPHAAAGAPEIADDLALKLLHCRALGLGMGGKIRVSITARRNGAPVNNWQVFYLPKIFEHAEGVAPGLIPKWTSPAEELLEPGRYLIWAQDPVSKKTSERQIVPFAGRAAIAMDLAVP